jgi:hypothetical protein
MLCEEGESCSTNASNGGLFCNNIELRFPDSDLNTILLARMRGAFIGRVRKKRERPALASRYRTLERFSLPAFPIP